MLTNKVPRQPVILVILDGFGVNPSKINNAVLEADTPNLDRYFSSYSHTMLQASGTAVGLPDGQMGNSEVGHLTLGSGSVIPQNLIQINQAIESGAFFENQALLKSINLAKQNNRPLHLLGLVSDGGVHSSLDHLLALLKLCKNHRVKHLLHMITDGRDTPPKSALTYWHQIRNALYESGGSVATITGRYYAMDRDNRWERTELAWRAITLAKGQSGHDVESAIKTAYAAGDTDEFIRPIIMSGYNGLQNGDQLISFNFRKDRPRQIVDALGQAFFNRFDRGDAALASVTCMTPYSHDSHFPFVFNPAKPAVTLGQLLSEQGIRQFHCAETEKYPHVTYFFNGGKQSPYSGETQLLIPSPTVATYDMKPEMSAPEVADAVIDAIKKQIYGFIVVNFANGDMVGHTARYDAVINAVEVLDREVGRVLETAIAADYSIVLTADHGNCEEVVDPVTHEPHTQHTLYPVPCLIVDKENWQLSCGSGLANVAPTILDLMGFEKPAQMTAGSILLRPLTVHEKDKPMHSAA
ncbi:2,3-bisphosphoglycerate-independent phosphoglycerate mutase [Kaarinaea lacus]